MPEFNEPLDIFGQNPRLSRLYTQLCFCFPLPDVPQRIEKITGHIQKASDTFTSTFPWVAGQVVRADEGTSAIVPSEESLQIYVQDKRDGLPTFKEYRNMDFPFKWLDEKNIASHSTLPDGKHTTAPVLALQATFISGGMILTFSAQHNCMDMAGQCEMIRLFAKACHGRASYATEELNTTNLPRKDIIPLLDDMPDRSQGSATQAPANNSAQINESSAHAKAIWSYFLFSNTALSTLKSLAEKDKQTEFISTDDALCAFLWKHITKSRLPRLTHIPGSTQSTFERQVDVRKHLGLSTTYPGNAVYKTSTTHPVETIVSEPLGYLASALRASLSPTPSLDYRARHDATKLHQKLQAGQLSAEVATRGKIPPMDIKMSSWAKEQCYDFDFGGELGKAEAVRRPSFEGWEGLAYLLPKARDGEIAAAVCLRDADLRKLREDEEFGRFGRYIG